MNHFRILLLVFMIGLATSAMAQAPEMADRMRSEGKIYVVVAIVLTVVLGLLVYLFTVDRKITKLEKEKGGAQ